MTNSNQPASSDEVMRLPAGWIETTLGSVVARPRSKASPAEHPELRFVGMDHIPANSMTLAGSARFGDMKSNGGLFLEGDVLYGRMRPYLNKVHVAKFSGACSAEFIVFPKSAALDGKFLAYLLHDRKYLNFSSGIS
jgi:type I restriction enzyme S subunit